ncbi:MAG: hypothetical protein M0P64_03700 [Candidatus Pacebacteria bacterium]|jgi:diadenosine tetraphosphate (Ap4A) HIT family hydrolase|nr:hypothetical protein [Candidatus Paceibacterota bacterium]
MKPLVNISHAREKKDVYEKIIKDEACPFCVDFSKKRESFVYHNKPALVQGKHWVVTENFNPYKGAKHHLMFVHRRHIVSFTELTPAALKEFLDITKKLEKDLSLPAGVFLFRFGDTDYTGGSVSHLHAHYVLGTKKRKDSEPLLLYAGYKTKK